MNAGDILADAPIDCDGLRVHDYPEGYTVRVGNETRGRLRERAAREALESHPAYVKNYRHWERVGGEGTPRRAFLRRLEGADEHRPPERYDALESGIHTEWAELEITVRRAGNGRRYGLRHREDAGRPLGDLDALDPLDLRERVKHTDDGRYRPLKTAPTLPTGWVVEGLEGADLVRAVDFVYPASVPNWHRERHDDLDVSHFRETGQRQTGIYGVVGELEVDALEWLTEAACVDSQCLKRREWDEDGETELDVPRGDGEFPCREPCSLFVAAARKIAILENEEPREYTVELTPSEKAQLDDMIDALAEGRAGEIREADVNDGANRYRARYLRAKRVEDGELQVVERGEGGE
jgi:hypothetical protein